MYVRAVIARKSVIVKVRIDPENIGDTVISLDLAHQVGLEISPLAPPGRDADLNLSGRVVGRCAGIKLNLEGIPGAVTLDPWVVTGLE